uniref:Uncharacterized protein n=1 Tax=Glossina austeni TaxID=7395 RepID=A0A1A9V5Z0_GLOAU
MTFEEAHKHVKVTPAHSPMALSNGGRKLDNFNDSSPSTRQKVQRPNLQQHTKSLNVKFRKAVDGRDGHNSSSGTLDSGVGEKRIRDYVAQYRRTKTGAAAAAYSV